MADATIELFNTWVLADGWAEQENFLAGAGRALLKPEPHAELGILADLHSDNPALRDLMTILAKIAADGFDATLARYREDDRFWTLLRGWIDTPTWTESHRYLAEHPELLADPRTRTVLAGDAEDPTSAQHLAILDLAGIRSIDDVYDLILDPAVAQDEAMTAASAGDAPTLARLLTATAVLQLPFVGRFVLGVHLLLTGDPEQAAMLIADATEEGTDVQREAGAARLRRLRTSRPDLADSIDRLVDLCAPATDPDNSEDDGA